MDYTIIHPEEKQEGAGAKVKRLFPSRDLNHLDPFVLSDEFFVEPDKGFPTHAHGGFEAITYIIEGSFRHKDNLENDSTIGPGGVQRFTAGKRIEHSEMPGGDKLSHGFQLWVNLPQKLKEMDPSYQKVSRKEIPIDEEEGAIIRTIVGGKSPVKLETEILYKDIELFEGGFTNIKIPENYIGFIYVYEGEIKINNSILKKGEALYSKNEKNFSVHTEKNGKFVLVTGRPHNEPIRLRGSFVR